MQLDVRTILLALAAGNLIMAVGLIVVNVESAAARGGRLWIAGNLAWFCGWVLLMLRGITPPLVSVILGNSILAAGLVFEFDAICMFRKRPYHRGLLYAALVLQVVSLVTMYAFVASPQAYIIECSLFGGLVALALVVRLLVHGPSQWRSADGLAVAVMALIAFASLFRAVHTIVYPQATTTLLVQNAVQSGFFAALYVATIGSSYAFLLMTKQESDAALLELATRDSLTGALNRRAFISAVANEQTRCRRLSRPISLLMMDLDHFKDVNDRYGHLIGDKMIVHFADVVRTSLRPYDLFGRYGGEEFVILLPENGEDEAAQTAQRICESIAGAPLEAPPHAVRYTVSIGVASCPPNSPDTLDDLLKRADAALYEAKSLGRNRVVSATPAVTLSGVEGRPEVRSGRTL